MDTGPLSVRCEIIVNILLYYLRELLENSALLLNQ